MNSENNTRQIFSLLTIIILFLIAVFLGVFLLMKFCKCYFKYKDVHSKLYLSVNKSDVSEPSSPMSTEGV